MAVLKTAKEVLMHAMQLAGVNNLAFADFFNVTMLENNLYRRIYEKVANSEDGYYDCEFSFSGDRCSLPEDIFVIKRVIRMNGDREVIDLNRQAGQTYSPGQFSIRNNEIVISGGNDSVIKVIYAPMPKTLTVPDKPELIPINRTAIRRFIGMNDKELFYEDIDGAGHTYNFRSKEDKVTPEVIKPDATEFRYCGGVLKYEDDGTYSWTDNEGNTEDVTEILECDKTIKNVITCDPYIAVTYDDSTIKIFNGWEAADYNIFAYKGRDTLGEILAMCTNDYTGKGVVFYSEFDNKLYYCSFVPDTVLNYPEQVDFNLLEMSLAKTLAQMAGTNSSWIENEMNTVEKDFNAQLMRCKSSVMRINNVRPINSLYRR